jgi:hypothetical protein
MDDLPLPPPPLPSLALADPSLPAELHRLHELALESRRLLDTLYADMGDWWELTRWSSEPGPRHRAPRGRPPRLP